VTSETLTQESRETLRKGSKSFNLATFIFSKDTRESVYLLYSWCRHCDDVTDGSVLGFNQNPMGLELSRVDTLQEMTHLAVRGEYGSIDKPHVAFGMVARKYGIPVTYADDLLEGMKHDAELGKIRTQSDLLKYCYQVAGTVGLMMCHIMGLKNPRALKNAVQLGIALQLTNIARDIGDDYRVGKIYLPEDWLKQEGISQQRLLDPENSQNVDQLVKKLLLEADHHYKSGLQGLIDLPWRPALAVAVASSIYRTIGLQVLKAGDKARKTRITLGPTQKTWAIFRGLYLVAKTIPLRLLAPRRVSPIREIWRYS